MFSRLGAFGAPFDLVVSGINPLSISRTLENASLIRGIYPSDYNY
jgi:hypothetical protein